MKKITYPLACAIGLTLFTACSNEQETSTTTDSMNNATSSAVPNENQQVQTQSYVDLYTGTPVQVEKDEATGRYMNKTNTETVQFYINTSTSDTFDMSGRVVNNALIKMDDGKYKIDEAKVKFDEDGDIKIKDGDTKIKYDESSGNVKVKQDGVKEKYKDDKYKVKTDDQTIKVKDGEVKVKN